MGTSLSPAQVFTTLALLNMLIFPMNAFPWVINGAIEARVSAKRLASILIVAQSNNGTDSDISAAGTLIRSSFHVDSDENAVEDPLLVLVNAKWRYSKPISSQESAAISEDKEEIETSESSVEQEDSNLRKPLLSTVPESQFSAFTLGPISYRFYRGRVYMMTGGVGCGKSTFLLALLNELPLIRGFYSNVENIASSTSLSYCAQTPSMHAGSVRDNILMGAAYNQDKYKSVLTGCQLLTDIQVIIVNLYLCDNYIL